MATVQYALDCPRVNDLLLTFTRDAVCTHMVDGLFFLWAVQAASGVFLIIALVIMRLVMQSFYIVPSAKVPTPTPMTGVMPQGQAIAVAHPIQSAEMSQLSKINAENTV